MSSFLDIDTLVTKTSKLTSSDRKYLQQSRALDQNRPLKVPNYFKDIDLKQLVYCFSLASKIVLSDTIKFENEQELQVLSIIMKEGQRCPDKLRASTFEMDFCNVSQGLIIQKFVEMVIALNVNKYIENVVVNLRHDTPEINSKFFRMIMKHFHIKNLTIQNNNANEFFGFYQDMNIQSLKSLTYFQQNGRIHQEHFQSLVNLESICFMVSKIDSLQAIDFGAFTYLKDISLKVGDPAVYTLKQLQGRFGNNGIESLKLVINLIDKEQENVKDILKCAKSLNISNVQVSYEGNCAQICMPTHLIQRCSDKSQEQVLGCTSYSSLLNADQMEYISSTRNVLKLDEDSGIFMAKSFKKPIESANRPSSVSPKFEQCLEFTSQQEPTEMSDATKGRISADSCKSMFKYHSYGPVSDFGESVKNLTPFRDESEEAKKYQRLQCTISNGADLLSTQRGTSLNAQSNIMSNGKYNSTNYLVSSPQFIGTSNAKAVLIKSPIMHQSHYMSQDKEDVMQKTADADQNTLEDKYSIALLNQTQNVSQPEIQVESVQGIQTSAFTAFQPMPIVKKTIDTSMFELKNSTSSSLFSSLKKSPPVFKEFGFGGCSKKEESSFGSCSTYIQESQIDRIDRHLRSQNENRMKSKLEKPLNQQKGCKLFELPVTNHVKAETMQINSFTIIIKNEVI